MIVHNQAIYPFSFDDDDTNIRAPDDVYFIREGRKHKQFFKGQPIPASIWGTIFGIVEQQVDIPPEDVIEQFPLNVSETSEVDFIEEPFQEEIPEILDEVVVEASDEAIVLESLDAIPLGTSEATKATPKKRKTRRRSIIKKS